MFSLLKHELVFPGSSCQVPAHVCLCVPLVTAYEPVVFAGNKIYGLLFRECLFVSLYSAPWILLQTSGGQCWARIEVLSESLVG